MIFFDQVWTKPCMVELLHQMICSHVLSIEPYLVSGFVQWHLFSMAVIKPGHIVYLGKSYLCFICCLGHPGGGVVRGHKM